MTDTITERPRRLSRRGALAIGGAVGAGVATVLTPPGRETLQRLARTSEQAAAAKKFNEIPPEQRQVNLVAGLDGAILRNRPDSRESTPGESQIGYLLSGKEIREAITVEGNDPQEPGRVSGKAPWYFIPQERNRKEVISGAFSYAGNFRQSTSQPIEQTK